MTWIVTYTGKRIDLFHPHPAQIEIEDIAHALAHLCRFGGHTVEHYSVAQHSVLVSRLVPDNLACVALMHDAAEAYIGDIVRPLKQALGVVIETIERNLLAAISYRFDYLPFGLALPEIKRADEIALMTEKRDVLGLTASGVRWDGYDWPPADKQIIEPQSPLLAKAAFLQRWHETYRT